MGQKDKGKNSGSRVIFTSNDHGSILLHKPHPRKELLDYQVKFCMIDLVARSYIILSQRTIFIMRKRYKHLLQVHWSFFRPNAFEVDNM